MGDTVEGAGEGPCKETLGQGFKAVIMQLLLQTQGQAGYSDPALSPLSRLHRTSIPQDASVYVETAQP